MRDKGQAMAQRVERARERNPQGQGLRLREELIAAAGRLLAEDADFESLSLRGVAREAGVAAPSVYLHFSSKDDLLRAVIDDHFARLRQSIEAALVPGADPASRLLAGCLAYCRYAAEQTGSYRLLFSTPGPSRLGPRFEGTAGQAAFQVLVDAVATCIAEGVARPGDPFRIAVDIWSTLHGIASLRWFAIGFPWPPLEDQVRGILEAFTGIPYGELAAGEEITPDGTA